MAKAQHAVATDRRMNTAEFFSLKPVVSSRRRVLIVDGNVDAPHCSPHWLSSGIA